MSADLATDPMKIELRGEQLVITIDVSDSALRAAQRSKSGKALLVATTHGFERFGPVMLSLNCITSNDRIPKA